MVIHQFRNFGRQIFRMYEAYPLLMNTIAGGVVYMAGEITSQLQHRPFKYFKQEHWNQIMQITLLGAGENGIAMLTWYKLLNTVVGSGVTTRIVLIKCLLDQIFFATQQDFLFLILCAYNQLGDLPLALQDIKESFVTTWIMDCSLWPLVNFFGFAFIPYTLQPTYMACVSYFWQLYISNIAAKGNHEKLVELFNEIDLDQNRVLDFFELKLAFENRGVHVTNEEITQMINDADAIDVDTDVPRVPGKVDFEEFEEMLSSHCTAKSANNWRTILEKVPLVKGAKKAISRLHEMNVKKSNGNVTEGEGTIRKDQTQSSVESSPSPLHQDTSQFIPVEKINLSFVPLPSTHQSRIHPWLPSLTGSPSFHSYVHDPSIKLPVNTAPLSEREQALRNVKWSLSMLSGIAFFRYVVTKL